MAATADLLRELEDMTFDPALEGCCRRDVVENIRSGRVKLALQGADRAAARARMQQRAVLRDPAAAAALLASRRRDAPNHSLGGGDGDSSGSGGSDLEGADGELDPRTKPRAAGAGDVGDAGDADLDALRAARMRQLRAAAAAREGGRAAGYGRLNDVRPEKLLVGAAGWACVCVC
ncbi:hypothetical protein MNEG_14272 [Monoraphidium neglectum]|uniref:Uncharacterized protein n=1 Tax=Monoraphidium neglectum TaxID=145388 RepID=A0A0D2J0Y3_9CHLO|nr:hypothetical protein MNEG_14272 [Monoraphidium neglectum]KIY93692.1 hypothetical protein MNEG_14272 [Monoraphidium neglectum]|eukprot:XP_013892712.1 hypothetical protein MNEG_14272 [Monoraphidium neglectum]